MPQWTSAQRCAMQLNGRDILVSAAAGSGKTATLTERIIRSLTETDEHGKPRGDISRMLIVTFTRAAAAELRSRISSALSEAIAKQPGNRYLYRQLVALGSAQICTIDAFYQEPVRANFERLDLPSSFRLADDAELMPLKEQVLHRLIDEQYEASVSDAPNPDAPLDALQGNAFALAMDDLLPHRDRGDTAELLLRLFEKLIAYPEGVELLRHSADRLCQQADLPFAETQEGQTLIAALTEQLRYDQAVLRNACDMLGSDSRTASKYLPSFAHDLDTVESLLADLNAGRWEQAGERAFAYAPERLGVLKNAADLPFDPEPLKAERSSITKALRALGPLYFGCSAQELREQMLRTARTQRMLYALLSAYDMTIREEKNRRGVLDFSDVRRYLLQLLIDPDGSPTDIALALSDRYDAVYIDEYQDVDTVQDLIFSVVGSGGKRFMVGDIKQSIYSFRGAEPSIFADLRKKFPMVSSADTPPDESGGSCVFMSENFRCDRSIIDFTNAVCGYAFEACPDTLGYQPEDDLVCSKQPPREDYVSTPVSVVLLETPPRDQCKDMPRDALNPEAVYISDEIARLLREELRADGSPIRPSDIAVLMRSLGMAGDVAKALHAHGIETSYAARDNLATHPNMTLMVNLLSVIDNPHDDVPLMGLFSSPSSPLSLTDLLAARHTGTGASSLYDDLCLALEDDKVAWSTSTRQTVQAFIEHLTRWRALAATLPVDRLLRKLYGEPFLVPLSDSPALLCLYDHARHYQNASFCGLYQFLPYFRRLLADPSALSSTGLQSNEDAVQILSIHKSKGLEFPVVFLCGCASKFNEEDTRAPVMFDVTLGAAARLYQPDTAALQETITRRAIAQKLREKQTEEEMRILYVALTRARERLYLTARLRSQAVGVIDAANRPTRACRFPILSAGCYLDWVLAALAPANVRPMPQDVQWIVKNRQDYDHPHVMHTLEPAAIPPLPAETTPHDHGAAFYRTVLERHQHYIDPRAAVRCLPTKAAASKLRVAMLDSLWLPEEFGGNTEGQKDRSDHADSFSSNTSPDAEKLLRHRIELMQTERPTFEGLLQAEQQESPAERGTATHLFLQHCDFSRLAGENLENEVERLVQEEFLTPRAARMLRREQLQALLQSELFALLSAPDTKIWRELHFDRFLPYSRLTRNAALAEQLEGYTLYVQGSIDLLIQQPDGTLWLCDYKTDRIHATDDAEIRARLLLHHADQLRIYAEATEGLFGRRPDHILIYSLPLGRSIDLTRDLSSQSMNSEV